MLSLETQPEGATGDRPTLQGPHWDPSSEHPAGMAQGTRVQASSCGLPTEVGTSPVWVCVH